MDNVYAELKESARRLREDQFIASVKGPVLVLDIADRVETGAWIPDSATSIVSTVLFQGSVDSAYGDGDGEDGSRTAFRLEKAKGAALSIGRAGDCDIVVDHQSISKIHAYISSGAGGSVQIADAGSRNGVTVNGRRIPKDAPRKIDANDVIRIGATMARLVYPKQLYALLLNKPVPTSMRRPLRDRTYVALWAGEGCTFLADSVYRITTVWWVLDKTGSGGTLSAVALCTIIAMIVTLLSGGALLAHVPRARVLLLSVVLRAIVMAAIAALEVQGKLVVWELYAAAALLGMGDGLFIPNNTAMLPELVRREDLPSANALTTISFFTISIVGPGLAALLVPLGGSSAAFALVALAYVFAGVSLSRLPSLAPQLPRGKHAGSPGLRDAAKLMRDEPWLWITSLSYTLAHCISIASAAVALPLLIKISLKLDMTYYSVCQSLVAVGALIASVWMGKRLRSHRRGRMAYFMCFAIGCCILVVGLPITIYGIAFAWLLRGMAYVLFRLIWVGTLQELVPRHALGAVASVDNFVQATVTVLTFLGYGWLTETMRPEVVLVIGGAVPILVALVAVAHPRIRSFE